MKKLIYIILVPLLFINFNDIPKAFSFSDIDPNYRYKEAIDFIAEKNIVSGYPDNTFKESQTLIRAELLKIIMEAKYPDENFEENLNSTCFSDVPASEWFNKYVCFAKDKEVIEGYPDGSFKPANQVNLVEGLKMAIGTFDYKFENTDPWYRGIISTASGFNFIPVDFIDFNQKITRGQMADLVTRILKYESGVLEDYLKELKDKKVTYDTLKRNYNTAFDPLRTIPLDIDLPAKAQLAVPFTAQAPFGDWGQPYDEACEEASLIMAYYFSTGKPLAADAANSEINRMVQYENEIGYKIDISAEQVAQISINHYSVLAQVYKNEQAAIENIKKLIHKGHPVIIPVAGQKLGNPNFQGAGPPYHMLVITGYTETDFITNDPGTSRGESYRYPKEVLFNAIHNWAGSKSNVPEGEKAMIVLE